ALSIPVSRSNGFLFIQTDKPLYTPLQKVKVRAFSMNQELRPANRSIYLTFKVNIVEIIDVNNGIPSMQNPFKIPVKPKLGIWTIDASYTDDFTTTAKTDFEVKEYGMAETQRALQASLVEVMIFTPCATPPFPRYLHGAPVAEGETQVRRPESISTALYLFPGFTGTLFPGGITQEAEFATVKFVKSPYRLSLISTPPFIKPGLPYNIQVLVKDHLDQPVSQVPVRLVENTLLLTGEERVTLSCGSIMSRNSGSDGLLFYICNPETNSVGATLKVKEASSVRSGSLLPEHSNPELPGEKMVGRILVAFSFLTFCRLLGRSPQVLSKGKVVFFQSQDFVPSVDGKQNLNFLVTSSMVPSIRLLVFYILHGEGTGELVADSVWMDIKDKCVNSLQVLISFQQKPYKPNENIQLNVRTNQGSLVALSAVDSSVFTIRPNYRDPVSMVLRHIEQSDLGCGGGGGKNNADIFRLAGLTFMTNANADPSSVHVCLSAANSFGPQRPCCIQGMKYIPKSVSCQQFADQLFRRVKNFKEDCKRVFTECCEYIQQNVDQNNRLVLGRHGEAVCFCFYTSLPSPYPSFFPYYSDPAEVLVSLPLSVDVPLPYQVVRGEQLELEGSVYNQESSSQTEYQMSVRCWSLG
uniref:Anaphylatoxin-like domain-containing protein n=1 Tax=Cyprinodon variegatus TaxID=28743 RepID=A0A3Q2DTA9_CYPVA